MSRNEIFSQVVEQLLQGEVICEFSHEAEYHYLQQEVNRESINDYLYRIGRQLRQTMDGMAFFAAYDHLETDDRKAVVKAQFSDVINGLESLVKWLSMTQSAMRSDRPITPGDVIRTSSLLASIEDSPALCDELELLSKMKQLANNQSTKKGQLDAVLKKLVELGYLVSAGKSGSQYIATGKWSRLYDLMEFISTHEQLDTEEESFEQEGFVL